MDTASFIQKFEGYSSKPYKDVAGHFTCGWGHLILFPGMKDQYTVAECDDFLASDIKKATDAVTKLINVTLNGNELTALVDFVFNLGAGALQNSTLRKMLNAGDRAGAADQFLRWDKSQVNGTMVQVPGLVIRRTAERRLFLEPV